MSEGVDIMGHIAMWKGKRISSLDIDLVFDKYPSVDRPDVPIEKNFLHTLKRAMADWGKFEINKMWRAWDRTDVNRNVYEIVRKTNEHLHTVYREPFYVKLGVDLKTFYLYATRDDLMNDNKWERDPLEAQDPEQKPLAWYHDRIADRWDVYRNTYDSTLINHMIRDFMSHYLYVKELSPRVVWMNNSSAILWKDLSHELSSVGIQLLDFPPSHSAESIASLFKVVKLEFEEMSKEIDHLEVLISQCKEGDSHIKEHAEKHSEAIAKYRKEVETLKPVFSGMTEFEELAERNSKKTKRMTYENEVAKNSDLFDDIVL